MAKKEEKKINLVAEIPEIYTNNVRTVITAYEVLLQLGLETSGKVKPICNIRMSPQHAKRLAEVLTKSIAEYEEKIGKLP